MMRVFLVDDEPLAIRRLLLALKDMHDVEVVGAASDGDTALAEIRRLRPDVAILDIEMPGQNGIAIAAALEAEGSPEIVFLTAFDRYATDAFLVQATDYLLKPLRSDRLLLAIERARRRQAERAAARAVEAGATGSAGVADGEPAAASQWVIHVPDREGGRDLAQSEILWIEAARDYALIHTRTRAHILRTTMSDLSVKLAPGIVRVHRSAYVALSAVRKEIRLDKGVFALALLDGSEVQVGPSYATAVRKALREWRT